MECQPRGRNDGQTSGSDVMELLEPKGWDGSKDVPLIITLVGGAVERIVRRNERAGSVQPVDVPGHMHLFFCNKTPSIGVEMYLERVYKYAPCSPVCFLYSYIFLDRLVKKCPDLRLSNQNAHRLLISGVVLAAKFLDDRQYSNVHYAKVGGISTRELNMLEFEMLCQLDFSVFVQPQLLNQYLVYLFESPKGVSFRAQLEFKASQHLNSKSGHTGSIGINAP